MANQDQVSVVFRNDTTVNETASKAAGRPIFEDREVADIRFPGDRQRMLTVPAHESDPNATREAIAAGTIQDGEVITYAQVYNKQYLAFKQNAEQVQSGTPLSELPFLTEARRRELRAVNVNTAEQLAAIDGGPLKMLGPTGREHKMAAQAYLENAAGSSVVTQQAAQIAALQQQLADMRDAVSNFTTRPQKNAFQRKIEKLAAERKEDPQAGLVQSPDGRWYDQTTGVETDSQGIPLDPDDLITDEDGVEGGNDDASREATEDERELKAIQDCTNAELKAYIQQETDEPVRGNPSHETLVKRAMELAKAGKAKG